MSRRLDRVARQVGAATDEEVHAVLWRIDDQIEDVGGVITAQVRAIGDGDDQLEVYLMDALSELTYAQERVQQLSEHASSRAGGEH